MEQNNSKQQKEKFRTVERILETIANVTKLYQNGQEMKHEMEQTNLKQHKNSF